MKLNRKIIAAMLAISMVTATTENNVVTAEAASKPSVTKNLTITEGKKKTITVKGSFIKSKSFKSTNKSVATVNKKGVVTAVSKGKCKVKVTVKYTKNKKAKKVLKKEFITNVTVKAKEKPEATKKPEVTQNPSEQATGTPGTEVTKEPSSNTDVTTVPQSAAPEVTTAPAGTPEATSAPSATPKATSAPTATPKATANPGVTVKPDTSGTLQTYYPIYVPPAKNTSAPTKKPEESAKPSGAPTVSPGPGDDDPGTEGASVKVYIDGLEKENLVAEVSGVGSDANTSDPSDPTASPVIFKADAEDGGTGAIEARGAATVAVEDGGANGTAKAIKVSGRTADWHGAQVSLTGFVEAGNEFEISFWAKQSTGEDSKIDFSCAYNEQDGNTQYVGIKQFELPNDQWTKCEATYNIPEHTGDISVYWQSVFESNNFMDFYLDEFVMEGDGKQSADLLDLSTGLVKKQAGNPVMTSRLTADPWAMEYNGRVYVYGTNDSQQYAAAPGQNNNYSKITTLNCYSSADMVNWTDHGTINVKAAATWSANSWAPAVCHKTIDGKEKFFLYFANNAGSIGVLTADSPTGPWTDPIGKALIDRSVEGCAESEVGWLFDPAVLVDDDGTGYLYFGGIGDLTGKDESFVRNPKCSRVIKLGADMVSVDGAAKVIDAPFMFEDSGINKIGDKYYYSYCTNWTGEINGQEIDRTDCPAANIAVMESDSPMGEFRYIGCVMKNPGNYFGWKVTGNNHHCFTEFKGQLYTFYHTKKDSLELGTKEDFRTTYVDKLNLGENNNFTNKDGSVADTELTVKGVEGVATLDPYSTVEAETFAIADTVGTVLNTETSSNKDWLTNYSIYNGKIGGYIGVSDVEFGTDGASEVVLKLADSKNPYKELSAKLGSKITGKHTVYFVFEKNEIFMDSWKFNK